MKAKLDAPIVASLSLPKGRDDDIAWDTELEGFGLRLRRSNDGSVLRSWIMQYRANVRTRRYKLGTADKLKPAQAREQARKLLAKVQLGDDPQADKQAKRQQDEQTFRAVAAAYLDARWETWRPS